MSNHCVIASNGFLYINDGEFKKIINRPAVLIEPSSDLIHKYGEEEEVRKDRVMVQSALDLLASVRKEEPAKAYLMYLSSMKVGQQAYVINRMMEYTATGFVREFYEEAKKSSDEFNAWLEEEMNSVPID